MTQHSERQQQTGDRPGNADSSRVEAQCGATASVSQPTNKSIVYYARRKELRTTDRNNIKN